jgi:RimJ/RimL family protein N-acetyltransferase
MLISNPKKKQWDELRRNCLENPEDFAHLTQFPYDHVRVTNADEVRNRDELIQFLRHRAGVECWLVSECGRIVGFVNYGEVIPGHRNAFGLAIGRQFASRGYETRALRELICILSLRGVSEVNGFCHPENTGIIQAMNELGFEQGPRDPGGANAVKFVKRLCDNRPSRTENEMPATAHAAGNAIAPPARLASRGLAGQALEAGQEQVMSVCELRKLVYRTVLENLGDEYADLSGAVLYNGWSSLRPGPLYLMGLNPGGDPAKITQTVRQSIEALQENHCAYTDECWIPEHRGCRGKSTHQRRVLELIRKFDPHLRRYPERVFATNAIFLRSTNTQELKKMKLDDLWGKCWPVHQLFLSIVRPKLILCLGNGNGLSPFSLLRERFSEKSEVCCPSGFRHGKSFFGRVQVNHREGLDCRKWLDCMVVGVPHPSHYESTNGLKNCLREIGKAIREGAVPFR